MTCGIGLAVTHPPPTTPPFSLSLSLPRFFSSPTVSPNPLHPPKATASANPRRRPQAVASDLEPGGSVGPYSHLARRLCLDPSECLPRRLCPSSGGSAAAVVATRRGGSWRRDARVRAQAGSSAAPVAHPPAVAPPLLSLPRPTTWEG
jgi:hypothetical protein